MKTLRMILTLTATLFVLVSSVWGYYNWMDDHYALATELDQVEQRLDYKILSDQLMAVKERKWILQDRYPVIGEMPQEVREELRVLGVKEQELQRRIDVLERPTD